MIKKASISDVIQINFLGSTLHNNFSRLFHLETEIDNPDGIVLVYKENETVLGYLYAVDTIDNVDLLSIVVLKDYQNKHIGSDLLKFLLDNYCHDKSVTLEVDVNNTKAIEFYKKFNFVVIYTRKGYYNGVDAYLMRRN